jgi:TPR repeat protein
LIPFPTPNRLRFGKLVPSAIDLNREGYVNYAPKPFLLAMFLVLAMTLSRAQAPATPPTPVDPALLAKATAGDVTAEVQAGDAYAAGNGSPRDARQRAADYAQAALWYRKAADQGNIPAEIHLADLYRDGRGVPRDMEQAVAWYRKAAEKDDAGAQGSLGLLYSVGMGVPQDYIEAYYWLCLAAAAPGPNQPKYATNRQSVGEHITTDQQVAVEDRVAAWKAAHPHPAAAQ